MTSIGEALADFLERAIAIRCMEERPLLHGEGIAVSTALGELKVRWCNICKDWTSSELLACPRCSTLWFLLPMEE